MNFLNQSKQYILFSSFLVFIIFFKTIISKDNFSLVSLQQKKDFNNLQYQEQIAGLSQKIQSLEIQLQQYEAFKKMYENLNKYPTRNKIKTLLRVEYVNKNFNGNYIVATADRDVKIFKNDIVINKNGVFIGRVIKVVENKVKIQLINDQLSHIPVATNNGTEGFTYKSIDSDCDIFFEPINSIKPTNNDFVFTSSKGGLMKNKVFVGKIFYKNDKICIDIPQIRDQLNLSIIENYNDL